MCLLTQPQNKLLFKHAMVMLQGFLEGSKWRISLNLVIGYMVIINGSLEILVLLVTSEISSNITQVSLFPIFRLSLLNSMSPQEFTADL